MACAEEVSALYDTIDVGDLIYARFQPLTPDLEQANEALGKLAAKKTPGQAIPQIATSAIAPRPLNEHEPDETCFREVSSCRLALRVQEYSGSY